MMEAKGLTLLDEFRKEADFINGFYGLGDADHDTALERGHIYELMNNYHQHKLSEIREKLPTKREVPDCLRIFPGYSWTIEKVKELLK